MTRLHYCVSVSSCFQRDLQKQFGEGSRYKRLRREKAAAVDKYLDIVDRRVSQSTGTLTMHIVYAVMVCAGNSR